MKNKACHAGLPLLCPRIRVIRIESSKFDKAETVVWFVTHLLPDAKLSELHSGLKRYYVAYDQFPVLTCSAYLTLLKPVMLIIYLNVFDAAVEVAIIQLKVDYWPDSNLKLLTSESNSVWLEERRI